MSQSKNPCPAEPHDDVDSAGGSLPTVASTVRATAAAVGKAGLLTEMYRDRLAPAWKLWGESDAENAREQIAERKRRRREKNLKEHVDWAFANRTRTEERKNSTEADQLAEEWMENVQHIDPDEEELTAIWRSLFDEVDKVSDDARALVEAAKNLNPGSARFLLRYPPERAFRPPTLLDLFRENASSVMIRRDSRDAMIAAELERAGLLRKRTFLESVGVVGAGVIASLLLALFVVTLRYFRSIQRVRSFANFGLP